tara:strand:+ start:5171 stop:5332 length:162 start_codon:yes stop_codon:yes gene_type:complete
MWKIVKVTQRGKLMKTALAVGETAEDAWKLFEGRGVFYQYKDTTEFQAVEIVE